MQVRIRRSELATPASNWRMIEKAAGSEADLVFLDLEDAVAPPKKVESRANVIRALNELEWGRTLRAVRVNDVETQWAADDVREVVEGAGANLDLLIVPKVKAPRDVWFFDSLLTQLERKLGLRDRIGIEILIEETEALARVEEIAACCPRLEALILGVGDLSASQGIRFAQIRDPQSPYPGDFWHYARNRMTVAARANGLDAVDGPFPNFKDPQGYRQEATWASTMGCAGKWAIHPSQIEIANDVFAPSKHEVEVAQKMVEGYRAAERGGEGAGDVGGVLVDAATVRLYEAVLDRARLTGRL